MKNLKLKICSGMLALALAGTPISLAKADYYSGKEVVVDTIEQTERFEEEKYKDYFAEQNTSDCQDFGITHVHAYKDDTGKIVKWLASEQLEIDGLHWTPETREISLFELTDADAKEPHAHLYYSKSSCYLLPIYSEEEVIDDEFTKTSKIVFLSKDKCEELRQAGLFRAYDNIEQLEKMDGLTAIKEYSIYNHFMTLSPVYIDDKVVDMKNEFFKVTYKFPEEHYSDLLYQEGFVTTEEEIKTLPKYVELPKVKDYQRDYILMPESKQK